MSKRNCFYSPLAASLIILTHCSSAFILGDPEEQLTALAQSFRFENYVKTNQA
jgi:hypothetical protein